MLRNPPRSGEQLRIISASQHSPPAMLTLRSTLLRVALLYLGAVYGGMEVDDNERARAGHMSKTSAQPARVTCQNLGGSHVKTWAGHMSKPAKMTERSGIPAL